MLRSSALALDDTTGGVDEPRHARENDLTLTLLTQLDKCPFPVDGVRQLLMASQEATERHQHDAAYDLAVDAAMLLIDAAIRYIGERLTVSG